MTRLVMSAVRRSGRLVVGRPRRAAWTVAALAAALFVAGLAGLVALTIERWAAAHPGSGGALVVYLGEGVDDARARALTGELAALRGVERAELVSPEESARRLTRALGADPTLLDGVEPAALPGSVELTLAPGVRDVIAMSPTMRALRGAPGVVDGVARDDGDDRLAAALSAARTVAWSGAGLFAALALVIAVAALRLGLDRVPREAAVLHLLGASPAFAAAPTALAGAVVGVVAGAAAAGGLAAVALLYAPTLGPVPVVAPSAMALAGVVAVGGTLGLFGGGLAGVAGVTRAG